MWLRMAIRLLRTLGPGLGAGALVAQLAGPGFGEDGLDLSIPFIGNGKEEPKRRRRRRALTQSDRNDIAFISATLGAPAGKQFAMIIASRVS